MSAILVDTPAWEDMHLMNLQRNDLRALGDGATEPFRDMPVAVLGGHTFA